MSNGIARHRVRLTFGLVVLLIGLAPLISCGNDSSDDTDEAQEQAIERERARLEAHIEALNDPRFELVFFYGPTPPSEPNGSGTFEARIGNCQMEFVYHIEGETVSTSYVLTRTPQDGGSVDRQEVFFDTVDEFLATQPPRCTPVNGTRNTTAG